MEPRSDGATTLEADDERRVLLQRMQRLENRECTILELRYGLGGEAPMTLKEIGHRLGITREWVEPQNRAPRPPQARGPRRRRSGQGLIGTARSAPQPPVTRCGEPPVPGEYVRDILMNTSDIRRPTSTASPAKE